jgi:putative membrane protein
MSNNLNKDLILREKLAIQRTNLANQSTFLSFLRTSMYFMIAGLSVRGLLKINNGYIVEIFLHVISSVLFFSGIINYIVNKKIIKENEKHVGDYKMEYLDDSEL